MAGKSAVDVIARHFLPATNRAAAFSTEHAFATGQNCRNDDGFANQFLEIGAGFFDQAANFMAKSERGEI
jgi:hypothetical protein